MKEVNQQAQQQAQQQAAAIQQIGNYAMYHNQLGHNAAEFMVGDVIQLARAAMQTSELEEALRIAAEREDKIRNDWKAEVDGLVSENDEANIRVNEMKIDVTNAEAYSQDLACQLDAARKEVLSAEANNRELSEQLDLANRKAQQLTNLKEAAAFWYDAFKDVHMAIGGDDAVNVAGVDDNEFVSKIIEAVNECVSQANSKRNDSHKIFIGKILGALGIDEGYESEMILSAAKQIKLNSDSLLSQSNEWRKNYNELCNALEIDGDHVPALKQAIIKAKAYKKYNELKNALGMAGIPHNVAVERAKKYTPDY